MAVYMIDTDISSYITKRSHDAVLRRLQKVPVGDVCISVITKSELMFGIEVSPRRRQDRRLFRLDRIEKATLTKQRAPKRDLDDILGWLPAPTTPPR